MLNKVGGVTSEVGLEVGSKALGGLGGAYSAEQGIDNLVNSGGKSFFKKGESGMSEISDVGNIAGAALDMASIALPVLAPFALATNLVSAGLGTVGTLEDLSQEQTEPKRVVRWKPYPEQHLLYSRHLIFQTFQILPF